YKSGSLTFAAGQTTALVPVTVYGDTVFEPDETFYLYLYSPTNATIARSTATGTIVNDDTNLSLSVADVSVNEGNTGSTPANFVVTLSQASTAPVTFSYYTYNSTAASPADFAYTSGSITLSAGQT